MRETEPLTSDLDRELGGVDRPDLYRAVRDGNVRKVISLLEPSTNLNKCVSDGGWTLLHVAAASGHLQVVEVLLRHGINCRLRDTNNWTALDLAAFRGHLDVARQIHRFDNNPHDIVQLKDPQSDPHSRGNSKQAKDLRDDSRGRSICKLIVSLGPSSNRSKSKTLSINEKILSSEHRASLSLSISLSESPADAVVIDLPKDMERINQQPLVFAVADSVQAQLVFQLIHNGHRERNVLGIGIALLSELTNGQLPGHHSLMRDFTIPIISSGTPGCLATTTFNFTIAKPYHTPFETKTPRSETPSYKYWSESAATRILGHRGTGANTTSRKTLQLGENTVESLRYALTGGAEGVEFDVQLTKDFHPVIFHNFTISEIGAEMPIHGLTKEQFLRVNAVHSSSTRGMTGSAETRYHLRNGDSAEAVSETATTHTAPRPLPRPRPRASSTDIYSEDTSIADRMRTTPDFASPDSIKGNLRGFSIQSPYATLEDFFRRLPAAAAFNIEMKYPMNWELEDKNLSRVVPETNLYVDRVLDVVRQLGAGRVITFSSFSPDVCVLLAAKQREYPVFFLTKAGNVKAGDDRAASLRQAVRFAKLWDLDGVVTFVDPLLLAPGLVRWVRSQGLFLATYGDGNDDPDNAKMLARLGVDCLIVNRVRAVVEALKEDRNKVN